VGRIAALADREVKDRAPAIDAHAYVDNCLSAEERKAFEVRLSQDAELHRRVDLWQLQSEAIRAAFGAPGHGARANVPHVKPTPMPPRGEIDESALRLFTKTQIAERAAPEWTALLRRPATRVAAVLIGITFFPGGMSPTPRTALAEVGASAFRAFASAPVSILDFPGGAGENLARRLGPAFLAARVPEWATPLGWTLRGAKRVPGLRGEAILILLEGPERRPLGVFIEPLDAPASSAIRIDPLGGMLVAAFTRRGFGFAVAGAVDGEVEAWLSAAGFADDGWPQLSR
jgi:anti-sigma factor RsiW